MEKEVIVSRASSRREWDQCLKLVHDVYVREGFIEKSVCGRRVLDYHRVEGVMAYGIWMDGHICGTVTKFVDSEIGLPLDNVYGDVLKMMRLTREKYVEVGQLVDEGGDLDRMLRMMALVFFDARRDGVDGIWIGVHPRHVRFYERYLNFAVMEDEREYNMVRGARVVLMKNAGVHVRRESVINDKIGKMFFEVTDQSEGYSLTDEDIEYLLGEEK